MYNWGTEVKIMVKLINASALLWWQPPNVPYAPTVGHHSKNLMN